MRAGDRRSRPNQHGFFARASEQRRRWSERFGVLASRRATPEKAAGKRAMKRGKPELVAAVRAAAARQSYGPLRCSQWSRRASAACKGLNLNRVSAGVWCGGSRRRGRAEDGGIADGRNRTKVRTEGRKIEVAIGEGDEEKQRASERTAKEEDDAVASAPLGVVRRREQARNRSGTTAPFCSRRRSLAG